MQFYSGATGQVGRFSEGFCLRRVHSRFACPSCGAADCPAYDTERMTWRHLNFFQHQAYLNARVSRWKSRQASGAGLPEDDPCGDPSGSIAT